MQAEWVTLFHDWQSVLTYKSSPKHMKFCHIRSNRKTTSNSVKHEVLFKQYLPAFLDISDKVE